MTLIQILIVIGLGLSIGIFLRSQLRLWAILLLSLFSVYLFQPLIPLRNFDYWFPSASIALTVLTWFAVRKNDDRFERTDFLTIGLAFSVILTVGFLRFIPFKIPWFPSATPPVEQTLIFLLGVLLVAAALTVRAAGKPFGSWLALILLMALFLLIKTEPLALMLSERIREWQGQSLSLASTADLQWLGFSYISFRLIHVIRDRQSGRLPSTSLREFTTYVLFFPALVAGPIDRIDRFIEDLEGSERLKGEQAFRGGRRILIGLFKKFVVADSLALLALNPANAQAAGSTGWTWVLVYAYAFRLFLDFSGYTDMAIGIGILSGVKLPENFDKPYRKPNMTSFWNAWHITLARWFRTYYFNPLTRWLRSGILRSSPGLIVLIGQISTMLLIGLWHGVNWNFAIWGLWHGVGLYVHNRWVAFLRRKPIPTLADGFHLRVTKTLGVLLTFNFTALGWVWFALPEVGLSMDVFGLLFGLRG